LKKSEAVPSNSYTDLDNLYIEEIHVKTGRLVYPVDLTENLKDLNVITEKLRVSKAEAIRTAIKYYAEYVCGLEVVTYRKVSRKQAKKEIERYLKGKPRVWTDEISDDLLIDPGLINEVLLELWEEGWVEPKR
jgi:hypothetical protein